MSRASPSPRVCRTRGCKVQCDKVQDDYCSKHNSSQLEIVVDRKDKPKSFFRRSRSTGKASEIMRYEQLNELRISVSSTAMAGDSDSTPIFTEDWTSSTTAPETIQSEYRSEHCRLKTKLMRFQLDQYEKGNYVEIGDKLMHVNSLDGLRKVFSEHKDVVQCINKLAKNKHYDWLWKESTWGWMSNWFLSHPPVVMREKYPVLFPTGKPFKYHCMYCAKGDTRSEEKHGETEFHKANMLRWFNMYGKDEPLMQIPTSQYFRDVVGGRFIMDVDSKLSRTQVPITQDPHPEGHVPLMFKNEPYKVPKNKAGYVVFEVSLQHSFPLKKFQGRQGNNGSAVKLMSETFKFGPQFLNIKKQTYFDLFCTNPPKKGERVDKRKSHWKSLAIPIEKAGTLHIFVNNFRYATVKISRVPAQGRVRRYLFDDKGLSKAKLIDSKWLNVTIDDEQPALEEYLRSTYEEVKSGVMWPVQALGPDGFMLSAMVYHLASKGTETSEEDDGFELENDGWDDEWTASGRSSTTTSGTISSSASRSPDRRRVQSGKSPPRWRQVNTENTLRGEKSMSVDSLDDPKSRCSDLTMKTSTSSGTETDELHQRKKDVLFYLHGDQFREPSVCPMPGLAGFQWPRPTSGPMKFATDQTGHNSFHGKIIIHPCSKFDMYWFRWPGIHDDKTFAPQVMTTLSNLREIACEYWGGNHDRTFVSGVSMGGYGAIELAAYWGPKIVKGAFFCCPSHDANRTRDYFVDRLREIPCWFIHGRADTLCKWEETASLVEQMQLKGAKELKFSCSGHDDFDDHREICYSLESKAPYEWLFGLSKN